MPQNSPITPEEKAGKINRILQANVEECLTLPFSPRTFQDLLIF